MFKLSNRLDNRGDTIVEVMIVLSILAFAFSISMATANKGLNQSRTAQEHSQALGVADSQLELLRKNFSNTNPADVAVPSVNTNFCVTQNTTAAGGGGTPTIQTLSSTMSDFPENANDDTLEHYGASCVANDLYHYYMTAMGDNTYRVRVRWDGVNGSVQQETMNYRIQPISVTTQVETAPVTTNKVYVYVPVKAYTTAGQCSGSGPTTNLSGINVSATIAGNDPKPGSTDPDGKASFEIPPSADPGTAVTAHITGNIPNDYQECLLPGGAQRTATGSTAAGDSNTTELVITKKAPTQYHTSIPVQDWKQCDFIYWDIGAGILLNLGPRNIFDGSPICYNGDYYGLKFTNSDYNHQRNYDISQYDTSQSSFVHATAGPATLKMKAGQFYAPNNVGRCDYTVIIGVSPDGTNYPPEYTFVRTIKASVGGNTEQSFDITIPNNPKRFYIWYANDHICTDGGGSPYNMNLEYNDVFNLDATREP